MLQSENNLRIFCWKEISLYSSVGNDLLARQYFAINILPVCIYYNCSKELYFWDQAPEWHLRVIVSKNQLKENSKYSTASIFKCNKTCEKDPFIHKLNLTKMN